MKQPKRATKNSFLARLLVRDRVLGPQIAAAEERYTVERISELRAEADNLRREVTQALYGVDDLDLATDVFRRAAERRGDAAKPILNELDRVETAIWRLEGRI